MYICIWNHQLLTALLHHLFQASHPWFRDTKTYCSSLRPLLCRSHHVDRRVSFSECTCHAGHRSLCTRTPSPCKLKHKKIDDSEVEHDIRYEAFLIPAAPVAQLLNALARHQTHLAARGSRLGSVIARAQDALGCLKLGNNTRRQHKGVPGARTHNACAREVRVRVAAANEQRRASRRRANTARLLPYGSHCMPLCLVPVI